MYRYLKLDPSLEYIFFHNIMRKAADQSNCLESHIAAIAQRTYQK